MLQPVMKAEKNIISMFMHRKRLIEVGIITLIFITAFYVYEVKEFSTPLLFGIDGPYYYVQVSSLLSSGSLKYPDPPLAFYILAFFSIVSNDVFIGVKVGSIFITLLALYAIYYLVKEITNPIGGLAACLFYAFSPALIRMSFDFIKNAMGLAFLSFTLLFLYLAISRRKMTYSMLASIFVVLTGLTHILDFMVIYMILLIVFAMCIRIKSIVKYVAIPFISGTFILLLGFMIYSLMGGDPYRIISFINSILHTREPITSISMLLKGNIILPILVGVSGIILSVRMRDIAGKYIVLALSIILILLNLPFIPHQYLWRFNLMIAILLPLILGIIIGHINDMRYGILVSMVILGFMLPQFISQYDFLRPSISLEEYNELKQLASIIPDNVFLVVPDVRLKYWVETLVQNVVKTPRDIPIGCQAILIFEKRPLDLKKPTHIIRQLKPPPRAKLLFSGEFIEAYILPPKPPIPRI